MSERGPISLKQKSIACLAIVLVSVVLDQLTKVLAVRSLKGQPGFSFLWETTRLQYAENTGAFLSLGAQLDAGTRNLFFVIGVLFIIGFCLVWLARSANNWVSVCALSAVVSGGVGNLIDRVANGYVVDFIYMELGPLHTGVFNVADIAITFGLIVMMLDQYLAKDPKPAQG